MNFAVKSFGAFVVGDSVSTITLEVVNDAGVAFGAAVGTGYTPSLLIKKSGSDTLLCTLTGAWTDPAVCKYAAFVPGTTATLVPATGLEEQEYTFLLDLDNGVGGHAIFGCDDAQTPFLFTMKAWA